MEAGVVAVREDPLAIDRAVSRISGRRMTFVRLVSGLPVLLLTMAGARTGAKRTQPLLYLREGDDLVVIGSNWGQAHNPAWYYNLRANPYAEVTLSGSTYEVIAREVTEPQRDLYWQQGCRIYRRGISTGHVRRIDSFR